ncbi:TPA: hypothetical protein ACP32N_005019 [Pseudomonas aeruginosa]
MTKPFIKSRSICASDLSLSPEERSERARSILKRAEKTAAIVKPATGLEKIARDALDEAQRAVVDSKQAEDQWGSNPAKAFEKACAADDSIEMAEALLEQLVSQGCQVS